MSRPARTSLDPKWFDNPEWMGRPHRRGDDTDQAGTDPRPVRQGADLSNFTTDLWELMGAAEAPDVLALVLDRLVDRLPEPERTCVHVSVMAGRTWQEAADLLSDERWAADPDAPPVHRKTAWKWGQRGLDQIRSWLLGTPWLLEMLAGRIPVDELPELVASDGVGSGLESALARTRSAAEEADQ